MKECRHIFYHNISERWREYISMRLEGLNVKTLWEGNVLIVQVPDDCSIDLAYNLGVLGGHLERDQMEHDKIMIEVPA